MILPRVVYYISTLFVCCCSASCCNYYASGNNDRSVLYTRILLLSINAIVSCIKRDCTTPHLLQATVLLSNIIFLYFLSIFALCINGSFIGITDKIHHNNGCSNSISITKQEGACRHQKAEHLLNAGSSIKRRRLLMFVDQQRGNTL